MILGILRNKHFVWVVLIMLLLIEYAFVAQEQAQAQRESHQKDDTKRQHPENLTLSVLFQLTMIYGFVEAALDSVDVRLDRGV